jgi:hypothetical protein
MPVGLGNLLLVVALVAFDSTGAVEAAGAGTEFTGFDFFHTEKPLYFILSCQTNSFDKIKFNYTFRHHWIRLNIVIPIHTIKYDNTYS